MYLGLVYNLICLLVSYLASFIIWTNVRNGDEDNEGLEGVVGKVSHCWVAVWNVLVIMIF